MAEISLLSFIGHLAMFPVRLRDAQHTAMESAARLVQAEARREIGTYQRENTGPFEPWQELADSTKDDRVRQGFTENDPGLRTGEMRDSIDYRANHEQAVVGSNDEKMVWFELGTQHQPPRSVLGTAAVHTEHQVVELLGSAVCRAIVGRAMRGDSIPLPAPDQLPTI